MESSSGIPGTPLVPAVNAQQQQQQQPSSRDTGIDAAPMAASQLLRSSTTANTVPKAASTLSRESVELLPTRRGDVGVDSRAMLGCTRCRFRGVREALATHIREEHGEEEEEEEEVVEEEEDDDDDDGQVVRGGRVVDAIAEADVIHGRRSSSPLSFGVHYESEHLQLSDVSQAREVSPRMTQLIDVSQVRQESAAPRDVSQKTQPIEASPVRQAAGLFNPPAEITLPSPAARKGASRTHKEVIEILSSQDAGVEFIGESRSAPPPPPPPAQEVEAVAPGSVNPQLMELVYNRKGGGGGGPSSSRKVRFEEPHENSEGELPDVAAQPIAVESESVLEYSLPPKEQAVADSGKGKRLSKKPPVVVVVASSSSGNERAEKKRTKKKRARGSDNVEEEEDEDDERDEGDDPAVDDEDVHEDDESFAPPLQTDSQLLGFEGSSTSVRKRRDAANSMLPPAVAGRSVAAQMAALAALATQNAGSADSPSSRGNSRRRKSVSPKEKSSDTKGQKRGRDNTEAAQEKASPQKKVTDAVAVTPSSSSKKTRSKQKKEDPQTPSSSSAWKKKKAKKVQQDEEPTTSKAKSPSKAIAEAEKIAPPLSQEVAAALPSTQEDGFLASPEDRPVLPRVKQQPVQGGEAVAGAALPKDQFQLSVPEPSQQGGLLYSQIAMGSQSQVPEYSQVPSYSLGNEIVYDLSVRGSPLKGSPVEEGEGEPSLSEEQVDAPASTTTSPKTYADRVRVKPQAAPKKKREPVVAAQWRRGRVNGENLRFVEPPNAEKIFQGFQFIVTGCKVVNELDPPEKHVKFMVNLGDSKEKVQLYEWIHEAITKNGGKELWYPLPGVKGNPILDQKTRLASSMSRILDLPFPSNVICISEKPHRTIKWMMAVAANVPVVDWKWIHACIRYGKLIDYHDHLLELGYSTVKDALVEYRVREGGLPLVFETCKMELVGSAEWKALWALVLREQGAEVVERLSIGNETSLDYIVSEEDTQYPSASLEKKARDLRIPLVGKEWIIQCLLNAKLLKHSLRPEFTASRLDE